jgi:hypothetical protein
MAGRGGIVSGTATTSSGPTGAIYGALGIVSIARPILSPAFEEPALAPAPPRVAWNLGHPLAPLPTALQAEYRDLLIRSDRVSPATLDGVRFGLDRGVLVLRGTAADAADVRTMESLLRFAPGVQNVRNEMTWQIR